MTTRSRAWLLAIPVAALAIPVTLHAETPPVTTGTPGVPSNAPDSMRAKLLFERGRQAILREDYTAAVEAFSEVLTLPETLYSRDAQEYLGLAQERRGLFAKAREAYEEYLRRYPDGDDARRIRQRLVNLPTTVMGSDTLREAKSKTASETIIYGGLSQFYYQGNSQIETRQVTANVLDQASLSLTDQSALITSLDLTARWRSTEHDSRVVLRDTYTSNFLKDSKDTDRLTAAYYEYKSKPGDWSTRLGRQPGNSGGALGRYDGASFGIGLNPVWRVNAMAGEPVEYTEFDSQRRFYGLNTDFSLSGGRWSGNLYIVRQTVDDIADRQAAGMELRYLADGVSLFSLLDYDTLFHTLNTAMLQGTWQGSAKTSYNLLLDWRKAPTLQTSTAVLGEPTSSIRELLLTYSEEELRRRAEALTATSSLASFGFTRQFNSTWQLGADLRVTNISETEGTTTVPASESSGNVYTLTGQAIGTGLFAQRDVTIISVSTISADAYDGRSLALTNRSLLGNRWTLDASARWYQQDNSDGSERRQINPLVRVGYKWKDNLTFEVELGKELIEDRRQSSTETTDRDYFSLGYRWDF
jgi:tetratricopeptide (TPR) repeat protein